MNTKRNRCLTCAHILRECSTYYCKLKASPGSRTGLRSIKSTAGACALYEHRERASRSRYKTTDREHSCAVCIHCQEKQDTTYPDDITTYYICDIAPSWHSRSSHERTNPSNAMCRFFIRRPRYLDKHKNKKTS